MSKDTGDSAGWPYRVGDRDEPAPAAPMPEPVGDGLVGELQDYVKRHIIRGATAVVKYEARLIQKAAARITTLEHQVKGYAHHLCLCEQEAGKVLGYPWYKDDQKNFPGATEADGVCIGEHVGDTIVAELAKKFTDLTEQKRGLVAALKQCATWFEEYAVSHQAQGKDEKANRNFARAQFARYAADCDRAALVRATGDADG